LEDMLNATRECSGRWVSVGAIHVAPAG
jgi:hypothetical protein